VFLIRVRPEQTEQRVPPVIPARLSDAEVSEQSDALGLSEKSVKLSSVRSAKIESTERPKLNFGHAASSFAL
jgi:hypothetical protein